MQLLNLFDGWWHMKMQCPGPLEDNFFSFKIIEQKFVNRCPNFHTFKLVVDIEISVFSN